MFNSNAFNQTEFKPRTAGIPVPQLADWFDGEPIWTVQSMTAEQNAIVNDAVLRSNAMGTLITAAINSATKDKTDLVKNLLGLGDNMPEDIVRRVEMLVQASVTPCDRETAVNLSIRFPTIFYALTNKIIELSGEGAEMAGKP